jgi:hypothetical protein
MKGLSVPEFVGNNPVGDGPMANTLRQDQRIDLVALDRHDQPVLAVEVKALSNAVQMALGWIDRLESEVRSTGRPIPYWMVVDLDSIIIISFGDGIEPYRVELFVPTAAVLSAYDSEFGHKRIFDDYLLALVEAWLRDYAFEWRSTNPPALKELTEIGLAGRLKGGSTHREVSIADLDPVRGNQFRDEPFPGTGSGD